MESTSSDIATQAHVAWIRRTMGHPKFQSDEKGEVNLLHKAFAFGLKCTSKLILDKLDYFIVPEIISEIDQSSFNKADLNKLNELITQKKSFIRKCLERYQTMIYLEEAAQSQYLAQFNEKNINIQITEIKCDDENGEQFKFEIRIDRKLAKVVNAIEENLLDKFTLKMRDKSDKDTKLKRKRDCLMSGQIKGKNNESIFLEILEGSEFLIENHNDQTYDIDFHVDRKPYRQQHNALQFIIQHQLFYLLIRNDKYNELPCDPEKPVDYNNFVFSGKLASNLNEEQKIAVINIMESKNRPLPYLVFGPAGTGKTRTLVAAIEEIVRSTSNHILVCANSNAACDEITERLLSVLHVGEMIRLYARSFNSKKIRDPIRPICNWIEKKGKHPGYFHFPSTAFLSEFRVLICTLCTAGAFSLSDMGCNHFSHIIIDECASTHETMSFIPIAGVCTSPGQIHSSIVLAGDPKQLDAVTKSKYADRLGFKTSFMEQLFKRKLYQRHPQTGTFNPKYITQLVKNYRSHSAILRMPNTLFYENKLEAKASQDITNWFIGSSFLPSKGFPIIFQSVQGVCKRSHGDFSSFSLFNPNEVDTVISYINKILRNKFKGNKVISQTDIGVVSPYKLQCRRIAQACRRRNLDEITVGTAEIFQGQEKPIIIVSTVRSDGRLGFVYEPRRLNVIITRAKCLLIIVGDPHTLSTDRNWSKFINYCCQNKALIQGRRPFHVHRE